MAASLWGLSAAIAKLFFTNQIDPLLVVQTRSSFAFLALLPIVFFKRDFFILQPRTLLRIMPLGIIGVAGSNFTYYYAVSKTTVAIAITLQYTAPILVALYQVLFQKKKVSVVDFLIIGLVLFGSYMTVTGLSGPILSHRIEVSGLLAGVASAFCWAFFNIYDRTLEEIPQRAKIFNALLFATLFWALIRNPMALARDISTLSLFGGLLGFAFLSVLLPYLFYFRGLKLSGALAAIVTANFEPVMAIFFSAIVVKESVSVIQALGGICVILGATLFNLKTAPSR